MASSFTNYVLGQNGLATFDQLLNRSPSARLPYGFATLGDLENSSNPSLLGGSLLTLGDLTSIAQGQQPSSKESPSNSDTGYVAGTAGTAPSGGYTLKQGSNDDPVLKWTPQIEVAAQKTGVPDYVIASIIDIESGGNPGAVSAENGDQGRAVGLMQTIPKYHEQRAQKYGYTLNDPQGQILAGADYLKQLHDQALNMGKTGDAAWVTAAGAYISGDINWQTDGNTAVDAYGTSASDYAKSFTDTLNKYRVATNTQQAMQTSAASGVGGAINIAKQELGKPYVFGGDSPQTSFDCSGLVQWSYKQAGINLPRTAQQQYDATQRVSTPQPGDLVFFTGTYNAGTPITHVGIYLGNGQMLDAQNAGVVIENINTPYWQEHFAGYGRVTG